MEDVFSFLEDSDLHEVAVIFKGECFHFNFFSTRYLFYNQCCNSYSLFVTSYSYSYITKNTTSYRYKLQMPKCN